MIMGGWRPTSADYRPGSAVEVFRAGGTWTGDLDLDGPDRLINPDSRFIIALLSSLSRSRDVRWPPHVCVPATQFVCALRLIFFIYLLDKFPKIPKFISLFSI